MRFTSPALVVTLSLLIPLFGAGEAYAVERLGVEIRIISAQGGKDHVDAALTRFTPDFKKLPYKSFRQLDFQAKELRQGEWVSMQFPGPERRLLKVQYRDDRDGKHRMRIAIDGLKFRTSIRIPDNGTIIVGGPRYQKGVILLAVTARKSH